MKLVTNDGNVLWCNGSTRDFGSLSTGSNPVRITNYLHLTQTIMTLEMKLAVKNLIRLNNLRIRKMLRKDTWQEFFLYKRIVANNCKDEELTEEVKNILRG